MTRMDIEKASVPRRALGFVLIFSLLAMLTGCDHGEIQKTIISKTNSGSADDGNDNNNPANGMSYPPGLNAKDNTTEAASDQPAYNKVGGSAKAIPAPPQGATKDAAIAKSFNQVKAPLVVTQADAFTFDIDLELTKPSVTKNASLQVQVRANVLDENGATMPNAEVTDTKFKIDLDANGKPQVTAGSGSEPLDANGNYKRKLSGPNKGIQLKEGKYQIELELRIIATASTAPGGDSATIDHATATIRLH